MNVESEDEQLTSDRDNLYFFKIQISDFYSH
jgi:hypothetical protein